MEWGLEEMVVNIPGLRTNSSSRLMAYPTVFNILSELGPKESQGSGQTECFNKRSEDVVDALGFPARPSIAAKVPAAGIWHDGQSSLPLAVLRRAVLIPVGVPAWEDSSAPAGHTSARDHGLARGMASSLPQGGNHCVPIS